MAIDNLNGKTWELTFTLEVKSLEECGGMPVWDPVRETNAVVRSINNHLEILTGRWSEEVYEITVNQAAKYRLLYLEKEQPPYVAG